MIGPGGAQGDTDSNYLRADDRLTGDRAAAKGLLRLAIVRLRGFFGA